MTSCVQSSALRAVVRLLRARGVAAHVGYDRREESVAPLVAARHRLEEPVVSVELPGRVVLLDDSVGVEVYLVARLELQLVDAVARARHRA